MKRGIEAELFRQAVAASQDGLVIADARLPEMPLIYVNPAFERLTGYQAAEVIGQQLPLPAGATTLSRTGWTRFAQRCARAPAAP